MQLTRSSVSLSKPTIRSPELRLSIKLHIPAETPRLSYQALGLVHKMGILFYGRVKVKIKIHFQTILKDKAGRWRYIYYHLQLKQHFSNADKAFQHINVQLHGTDQ